MKYSKTNPPLVCMMTNSTCYLQTRPMVIKGVLWHTTGANNPWLKRYVQPSKNDKNYADLMKKLGTNTNHNDWNHVTRYAGLNAWIGKLADGAVASIQTMDWNYRPWGCGAGPKGSCNDHWIQFEICEDALTDREYFEKAYKEAVELTAYLCKTYKLDPKGTVDYAGQKIPVILCHQDSYKYKVGSNHSDVYHWFNKYGKTMDDVRNDVYKLLNPPKADPTPVTPPTTTTNLAVGDVVTLSKDAKWISGKTIPAWVFNSTLYARVIKGDNITISTLKEGAVTGTVNKKYVTKKGATTTTPTTNKEYKVQVTADSLNVRSGPSINYKVNVVVHKGDVYTIVEEKNGWGKLKSGAGWVNLKYTKKI